MGEPVNMLRVDKFVDLAFDHFKNPSCLLSLQLSSHPPISCGRTLPFQQKTCCGWLVSCSHASNGRVGRISNTFHHLRTFVSHRHPWHWDLSLVEPVEAV